MLPWGEGGGKEMINKRERWSAIYLGFLFTIFTNLQKIQFSERQKVND